MSQVSNMAKVKLLRVLQHPGAGKTSVPIFASVALQAPLTAVIAPPATLSGQDGWEAAVRWIIPHARLAR